MANERNFSLRDRAFTRIAFSLWEKTKVRDEALRICQQWVILQDGADEEDFFQMYPIPSVPSEYFENLSVRVRKTAMSLKLPCTLKFELVNAVEIIGVSIWKWMLKAIKILRSNIPVKEAYPYRMYWSAQCALNEPRFFKQLLREKKIKMAVYSYLMTQGLEENSVNVVIRDEIFPNFYAFFLVMQLKDPVLDMSEDDNGILNDFMKRLE